MKRADVYVDLDGHEIALAGLDAEERGLVARLRRRARTHPDWTDYDNYWMREVGTFYDARGVARRVSRESVPFRIGQDLSSRLGIACGLVRPDDCEGDLEDLMRECFGSWKAFCKATGLGEEPLRQFLAGRGDLSIGALQAALERIGYSLRIRPLAARQQPTSKATARKRTG
jgi:hypothetical protein